MQKGAVEQARFLLQIIVQVIGGGFKQWHVKEMAEIFPTTQKARSA